MKVVQINAVNRYSSTGANTYELHRYLMDKGHQSYVFCTNESDAVDNIFRIGNVSDYKLHAFLSRVTGLQGYYSRKATRRLIKQLEGINPDIVLLGNLHSNYINLDLLFAYLSDNKIPVVNVLHDCWSFTGHCCHYTKIECKKWQSMCCECPLLNEDNVSYIDRTRRIHRDKQRWFHSLDVLGIVGVSDWIRDEARQSPIFPEETQFVTIYNWIDSEVFHPSDKTLSREKLGLVPDKKYAISVSQTWSDAKGLASIITLARSMPNVHFILIGNKPNVSDLPANIITPGVISDRSILSEYYSASDIYLNFSKQETFGKVSAEALACGLPVLSSDTTANPEVVGDCGMSLDIEDANTVRDAFKKIIFGEIAVSETSCRKRARMLFDKNTNLGQYLAFFENLIRLKECRG